MFQIYTNIQFNVSETTKPLRMTTTVHCCGVLRSAEGKLIVPSGALALNVIPELKFTSTDTART